MESEQPATPLFLEQETAEMQISLSTNLIPTQQNLFQQRWQALTRTTEDLYWTTSTDGLLHEDSPSWRLLTGQDQHAILHHGWLEAIHPDERSFFFQRWIGAGKESVTLECRIRDHRHKYRHYRIRSIPVHDDKGLLLERLGTGIALSDQQGATTPQFLEQIFETINDGLIIYNNRGEIQRANTAAQHLLGLEAQEPEYLLEHVSISAQQEADTLPAKGPLARILAEKELTEQRVLDIRLMTADQSDIQLNISASPLRNEQDEITGVVCVLREVTERRRMERRTQEALVGLVAMAEAVMFPHTHSRATGLLLEADFPPVSTIIGKRLVELTCSILNCTRAGIALMEPETEILHPLAITGVTPEIELSWRDSIEGNTIIERVGTPVHVARLYAGETVLLDLTEPPFNQRASHGASTLLIVPIHIEGQLVGIISIGFHKSDHKYTGEEIILAKTVSKLSALVIERERLLNERAEAQANEMALRVANRRMDDFISLVSHELRTPLTTIKASIQLAQRRIANYLRESATLASTAPLTLILEAQSLLARAERQVAVQNRLVGDLLEASRIHTNKLSLHLTRCNLASLIKEAVEDQRHIAQKRVITLSSMYEEVAVFADNDRIRQVVTNYLTNALKYSPVDCPIEVRLYLEEEQAIVAVRDEGPGLPEEEHERIWERFYRVENIERQSGSSVGLGLGLHICRTIIEQHKGKVGVQSVPGEGSTFWFSLPLLPEQ